RNFCMAKKEKEIRFQQLIKTAGRPTVVTLWTDPKLDRPFMRAVKENRVLTLIQEPTSKRKDFGQTGFHPAPHASYLVFPKSLPPQSRVVGIKYELIDQPKVSDRVSTRDLKPARGKKVKPPKSRRAARTFDVLIRRLAVVETSVTVPARDKGSARRQALEQVKREPFDLSRAVVQNETRAVDEH